MGHAGNDRFRCLDRHANATFFFTRPMCSEISACAASAEHLKRAPPTATVTLGARLLLCLRNYLLRTRTKVISAETLRESSTLLGRLSAGSSDERQAKTGPSRFELAAAVKDMPTDVKSNKDAPVTSAIVESAKSWLKEMYASMYKAMLDTSSRLLKDGRSLFLALWRVNLDYGFGEGRPRQAGHA